jgi:hypothetical protein
MKNLTAGLCVLMILFSCRSTHYTPKNYKDVQLIAGNSGGVSGMIREYCLLENGQLFQTKGITGEWKELPRLKKSLTRDIFNKVTELGLETTKFSHPGNMTYYLTLKQPSRSNTIKWGESGSPPPEGIKAFYDYLMKIY